MPSADVVAFWKFLISITPFIWYDANHNIDHYRCQGLWGDILEGHWCSHD